jgi:hypothetical protein
MSLFGKILDKLGLKKPAAEAKPAAPAKSDAKPGAASKPAPYRPTSSPQAAKPAPVEMVDVMSKLETMGKGTNLDWKVSIVDLLKLLDLDSSLTARKELATELGCPADKMGGDYSAMNTWLHKTVLTKIAENGGNIPKELLD